MYDVLMTAANFPETGALLSFSGSGLESQSYAFFTTAATELLN